MTHHQAPNDVDGPDRTEVFGRAGLLDTPPEPSFDRLTGLAARLLGVPVSLISLVDAGRQFFKSCVGLPEPWASRRETPLTHSFCRHVVASGAALVISDARTHPLVRDNPAIAELGIIAYLGIPIVAPGGHVLGSFCAISGEPRAWSDDDVATMVDLAASVTSEIALRASIAERRRAEEAAQSAHERYRLLVEAVPQLVWSCLPDGSCDYLSRQWVEYTGIPMAEQLGHGWPRALHPDDRERALARWMSAVEGRADYDVEYRIRGADGVYRWFKARGLPIRDPSGEITHWFGTSTNIDDQKQAEMALERSEARLRMAVEATGLGLFEGDPRSGTFRWSERSKIIIGLPSDEPLTLDDFSRRLHPDDRRRTFEAIGRAIDPAGDGFFDAEFRCVMDDGTERRVNARGRGLFEGEGEGRRAVRLIGTVRDVTSENFADEQLHRAKEAAESAGRRKDEFLAMLAHELRNPLASIRNAILLLDRAAHAESGDDVHALLERQVGNMTRLVDDLLDVARIGQGKVDLRKEPLDLAPAIRRAAEAARPLIESRRHELSVSIPPEPIVIEADPTRFEQILTNLLTNAAKYTDPGGRICLEAAREGDEVVIRVRDTGIGISPDLLPRIFDLYAQAEDHQDQSQGGLGIGLSLVRALVVMHEGRISAHSEGVGRGSEFVVRFLAREAAKPPGVEGKRESSPARRPAVDLPRRRVLVVDDDADAASSLAKIMTRLYDQDVRVANDGRTALEMSAEFRPEIVLLDLGLPGMDGYEVARRLRAQSGSNGMQLVALTGWGQDSDRQRSREAGFDRHLVKPVAPEALSELLMDRR